MQRQEELIRILLKSEKPLTTTELAKQLSVSSRTIRSDLEKIESELLVHHLCLEKKPHVGVWIQGAKEDKIALFLNVDQQNDTANTYSKDYRIGCILVQIIYVFLTIFLYLPKCPQSLILSALRAFCFCGKPHISRSIFLYFRYQSWLKSW